MRFLKILIGIVLVVVLIPIVALVALSFIGLNGFKPQIAEQVEKATGRNLVIDGDINLNMGLKPSFDVAGVSFENASWASTPNMAEVGGLSVQADLIPLLTGNVVVNHVILTDPSIWLETDANGLGNWVMGDTASASETTASDKSADQTGGGDGFMPLVQRLQIDNGAFYYKDGQTGQENTLTLEQVLLLAEELADPVTLAVAGALDGNPIDINGETGSIESLMSGDAPLPVDFQASALGLVTSLKGSIADAQNARGIDLLFNAQAETFAGFTPFVQDQSLPVTPDRIGPFSLSAAIAGDADAIEIRDLALSLDALGAALRASGGLGVAGGEAATGIDVALTAEDLTELAEALDAPIPNQPLSLKARIEGNPAKQIDINQLEFSFGPNEVTGDTSIALEGVRPKITSRLSGPQLDVAVFAAPAAAGESEPAAETTQDPQGKLFSDDPLPLDGLEAVDADIAVQLGKLITPQISLDDVDLTLTLQDGKLDIKPLTFGLAQSQPTINLSLERQGDALDLALGLDARSFDYGVLLTDLGLTDLLEGGGDIVLDLNANGGSVAALAGSLDGTITALMGKGRVRSAVLDQWIDGLSGAVDTLMQNSDSRWIVLECIALDLASTDGVLSPSAMMVNAELAVLRGDGAINLGDETIDMAVLPQTKAVGIDISIPIGIDGALAAPGFGLDQSAAANQLTGLLDSGGSEDGGTVAGLTEGMRALGADENHPCVSPDVSSAGLVDGIEAIVENPEEALEAITEEPEKILESIQEDPSKAIEEGTNLLQGILGGD